MPCMSVDDIKTDEDAREMLEAVSRDKPDSVMLIDFYETVRKNPVRIYGPRQAFEEVVYCFGLDLV